MLDRAVRSLKSGKEPDIDIQIPPGAEIVLHTPALLPDNYCPNIHERLLVYKRLASLEKPSQLTEIEEELIDRFGLLPPETKILLCSHLLRIKSNQIGITKIDSTDDKTTITFLSEPLIDPIVIIELVQNNESVRFSGPDRIVLTHEIDKPYNRAELIIKTLDELHESEDSAREST
jgi:transcription-repair coupling factor (superfamily II helicase)